jgi:7,8-dihydropterin-6-yl-methyl-4-(beta-D-ribofuranosyl)aminobenzene 5'-phosphate synthase
MNNVLHFGDTAAASVTTLVDNLVDVCLPGTATVRRYGVAHGDPLLGEHGLALLVDLPEASTRILWDAGITTIALPENMRRMRIDPHTIKAIALSHGHNDHFVALTEVLRRVVGSPPAGIWPAKTTPADIREWVESRRVKVIAHPDAFCERWTVLRDGTRYGPWRAPRAEWEAAGAEIVLSEGPYQLAPGCWVTGQVPRRSFETIGTPTSEVCPQGDEWVHDTVRDDQALVINVRDKGLVVLAGCAHAGIVNTITYAREISGESRIWGVIGGFHLVGATDEDIQRTIEEVRRFDPQIVVPTHCTGFKAQKQFAALMPAQFVVGSVGTTYLF